MMRKITAKFATFLVGLCAVVAAPFPSLAEDIDIFVGTSAGDGNNPSVLIVLDNTSNWSRQSQQWPGGFQQGQSEVRAIKNAIASLNDNVNVGLLEFVTAGNANQDGGFIRHHITPMTTANKASLTGKLDTIFNNINSPTEKRNSNTSYGNIWKDVYYYLAGGDSHSPTATPSSIADAAGYVSLYNKFKSPMTADASCGRTVVIFIGNADSNGPEDDSATNTSALAALGGNTTQMKLPEFVSTIEPVNRNLGYTPQCYSSVASCSTAAYASECALLSGCSCSSTDKKPTTQGCPAGSMQYPVVGITPAGSSSSSSTTSTTAGFDIGSGFISACASNANSLGAVACPANTNQSSTSGNVTTTVQTAYSQCGWTVKDTTGCTGNKKRFYKSATKTVTTTTTTAATAATETVLGTTSACYTSTATCSTAEFSAQCAGYPGGCSCTATGASAGGTCPAGTYSHQVVGTLNATVVTPTGTYGTAGGTYNADEWVRFLHQTGVSAPGVVGKKSVTTYTIDVFNAQQSAEQTRLLLNMAQVGGGRYFAATNEGAILDALNTILAEIQSINSTFASASLPINSTNRAQNANEVYLGIFRPDPDAKPRWFGNTKRYQLVSTGTSIVLGDQTGVSAVNPLTGFLADCAASYWTTDSGNYWENIPTNPPPGTACSTTTLSKYSDYPDGPQVEKGAIAEILRKGNNPPTTDTSPTYALNRTLLTVSGGTMANLSNTGIDSDAYDFLRGLDMADENLNGVKNEVRPSIHGDVIHSRPLPISYAGTTGTVLYYGTNDGTYRAIQTATGKELWAFVAPEFVTNSRIERLYKNTPLVSYPNIPTSITPTPIRKDYFFDGSTGIFQDTADARVWIYPTMRRGGRKVYALDVTTPTSPKFKWSVGCPNLTDDTGCTTGASEMGQTWSLPQAAFIKGFSATTPAIVMGGGYDSCEDQDTATPSCSSSKGRAVFIMNGDTGEILASFATTRSVAADPAMVDMNADGMVDFAYFVDTGGNVYRVDFANTTTFEALAPASWSFKKVGYTNGGNRKFLFPPALLSVKGGQVYVAVGSGDREHPLEMNYPMNNVTNRFYVFVDELAESTVVNMDDPAAMKDYSTATSCEAAKLLPDSSFKGWFMDLNEFGKGEQVVTSAVIAAGLVTFSTNRPIPSEDGSCSTPLGEARGYLVNLFNASGAIGSTTGCGGETSATFAGGGLPPSPVLATVPIDGQMTTVLIGAVQASGAASSPIEAQQVKPSISSKRKRQYWKKQVDN